MELPLGDSERQQLEMVLNESRVTYRKEAERKKKTEEEELKERKRKLNLCAIIFLWLKKNWTE